MRFAIAAILLLVSGSALAQPDEKKERVRSGFPNVVTRIERRDVEAKPERQPDGTLTYPLIRSPQGEIQYDYNIEDPLAVIAALLDRIKSLEARVDTLEALVLDPANPREKPLP